jgi:endonuclease/exonuclease/phosphatase family metal-dependent hydrolase
MNKIIIRVAKGVGIGIGSIVILVLGFFGVLTIAEYRPAEIDKQKIQHHNGYSSQVAGQSRPSVGVPFSMLSWNIGYASLDETQDFFMDGGKTIRPATDENVNRNLAGIRGFISFADCDVTLMQEADIASKRSYYINQREYLTEYFSGTSSFAYNFKSLIVPIPFPEIIGRVSSGLLTLSQFETTEAFRMSLPNPFSWPVRIANLKRCLLVNRIPLANSTAELVIVNLHLEAYDSSGGREAQTKKLLDFLNSEYAKGNYCIAGGDFNQNFPDIDPVRFAVKNSDYFIAGTLSPSLLAPGWQFAADTQTPSCRLLNEPYSGNPDETQLYVIDGFILSPNVELIAVKTFDLNFQYSDHNPVRLNVLLK